MGSVLESVLSKSSTDNESSQADDGVAEIEMETYETPVPNTNHTNVITPVLDRSGTENELDGTYVGSEEAEQHYLTYYNNFIHIIGADPGRSVIELRKRAKEVEEIEKKRFFDEKEKYYKLCIQLQEVPEPTIEIESVKDPHTEDSEHTKRWVHKILQNSYEIHLYREELTEKIQELCDNHKVSFVEGKIVALQKPETQINSQVNFVRILRVWEVHKEYCGSFFSVSFRGQYYSSPLNEVKQASFSSSNIVMNERNYLCTENGCKSVIKEIIEDSGSSFDPPRYYIYARHCHKHKSKPVVFTLPQENDGGSGAGGDDTDDFEGMDDRFHKSSSGVGVIGGHSRPHSTVGHPSRIFQSQPEASEKNTPSISGEDESWKEKGGENNLMKNINSMNSDPKKQRPLHGSLQGNPQQLHQNVSEYQRNFGYLPHPPVIHSSNLLAQKPTPPMVPPPMVPPPMVPPPMVPPPMVPPPPMVRSSNLKPTLTLKNMDPKSSITISMNYDPKRGIFRKISELNVGDFERSSVYIENCPYGEVGSGYKYMEALWYYLIYSRFKREVYQWVTGVRGRNCRYFPSKFPKQSKKQVRDKVSKFEVMYNCTNGVFELFRLRNDDLGMKIIPRLNMTTLRSRGRRKFVPGEPFIHVPVLKNSETHLKNDYIYQSHNEYHDDDRVRGKNHTGVNASLKKLSRKIHFKGKTKMMEEWVAVCERCLNNPHHAKNYYSPPLKFKPYPLIFESVAVDLFYMVMDKHGFRYVDHLVDRASGFELHFPLRTKEKEESVISKRFFRLMIKFIRLFGDNGSEIVNHIMRKFAKDQKFDMKFTRPNHPEENGSVESRNKGSRVKLTGLDTRLQEWSEHLVELSFLKNKELNRAVGGYSAEDVLRKFTRSNYPNEMTEFQKTDQMRKWFLVFQDNNAKYQAQMGVEYMKKYKVHFLQENHVYRVVVTKLLKRLNKPKLVKGSHHKPVYILTRKILSTSTCEGINLSVVNPYTQILFKIGIYHVEELDPVTSIPYDIVQLSNYSLQQAKIPVIVNMNQRFLQNHPRKTRFKRGQLVSLVDERGVVIGQGEYISYDSTHERHSVKVTHVTDENKKRIYNSIRNRKTWKSDGNIELGYSKNLPFEKVVEYRNEERIPTTENFLSNISSIFYEISNNMRWTDGLNIFSTLERRSDIEILMRRVLLSWVKTNDFELDEFGRESMTKFEKEAMRFNTRSSTSSADAQSQLIMSKRDSQDNESEAGRVMATDRETGRATEREPIVFTQNQVVVCQVMVNENNRMDVFSGRIICEITKRSSELYFQNYRDRSKGNVGISTNKIGDGVFYVVSLEDMYIPSCAVYDLYDFYDINPLTMVHEFALKNIPLVWPESRISQKVRKHLIFSRTIFNTFAEYVEMEKDAFINEKMCYLFGKNENRGDRVTHLVFPKQQGNRTSVQVLSTPEMIQYSESLGLTNLGWLHTHPSFSAFMSLVDQLAAYTNQLCNEDSVSLVLSLKQNLEEHENRHVIERMKDHAMEEIKVEVAEERKRVLNLDPAEREEHKGRNFASEIIMRKFMDKELKLVETVKNFHLEDFPTLIKDFRPRSAGQPQEPNTTIKNRNEESQQKGSPKKKNEEKVIIISDDEGENNVNKKKEEEVSSDSRSETEESEHNKQQTEQKKKKEKKKKKHEKPKKKKKKPKLKKKKPRKKKKVQLEEEEEEVSSKSETEETNKQKKKNKKKKNREKKNLKISLKIQKKMNYQKLLKQEIRLSDVNFLESLSVFSVAKEFSVANEDGPHQCESEKCRGVRFPAKATCYGCYTKTCRSCIYQIVRPFGVVCCGCGVFGLASIKIRRDHDFFTEYLTIISQSYIRRKYDEANIRNPRYRSHEFHKQVWNTEKVLNLVDFLFRFHSSEIYADEEEGTDLEKLLLGLEFDLFLEVSEEDQEKNTLADYHSNNLMHEIKEVLSLDIELRFMHFKRYVLRNNLGVVGSSIFNVKQIKQLVRFRVLASYMKNEFYVSEDYLMQSYLELQKLEFMIDFFGHTQADSRDYQVTMKKKMIFVLEALFTDNKRAYMFRSSPFKDVTIDFDVTETRIFEITLDKLLFLNVGEMYALKKSAQLGTSLLGPDFFYTGRRIYGLKYLGKRKKTRHHANNTKKKPKTDSDVIETTSFIFSPIKRTLKRKIGDSNSHSYHSYSSFASLLQKPKPKRAKRVERPRDAIDLEILDSSKCNDVGVESLIQKYLRNDGTGCCFSCQVPVKRDDSIVICSKKGCDTWVHMITGEDEVECFGLTAFHLANDMWYCSESCQTL